MRKLCFLMLFSVPGLFVGTPLAEAIDWVLVGHPFNPPHPESGVGSVEYEFFISRYETTVAQFVEFLNSVDPQGHEALGLFDAEVNLHLVGFPAILFDDTLPVGGKYVAKPYFANKPMFKVRIQNAMRFCNWLHHDKNPANVESGAYDLSNGVPSSRSPGARFYLPTRDEWMKAAYYHPAVDSGPDDSWWDYATRSDEAPDYAIANGAGNVLNPGQNTVNYDERFNWGGTTVGQVSTVGGCGASSYFGTFDQSGNVMEWTETRFPTGEFYLLGGNFRQNAINITAPGYAIGPPSGAPVRTEGFRLATSRAYSADMNGDGVADSLDVQTYVDCVVTGGDECPCGVASFVSAILSGNDCQ
ncbi:MAG TPA: SUMF1/EgtB/PvdO family nonheme iron enzyme [Phycisphaerae bacterium]|nr:SUMF1/EgtB/PvdO family nonheme iron enzyme [Phycisphaerae bacterium]HRW55075.1 SUMF1/EgtB/PvdO family nonheme iron enzyme [Phycisphaerae bacterium]